MLSRLAETVRRHDPDRFLTALFAPPSKRETLFLLYAFNHELARAREAVSQPPLALIRLQWWREVVEGTPKRHEVATPLFQAIADGLLPRAPLLAMIDAREAEADTIPTLAAWRAYVLGTAGELAVAAGRLLDAEDDATLRALGAAYGVAGILRSGIALAAQGRCLLPEDLLHQHGLAVEDAIAMPDSPRLQPVRDVLRAEGRALLRTASRPPRRAMAAVLTAVLARRDLARDPRPGPRGLTDSLAVAVSAWRGKV